MLKTSKGISGTVAKNNKRGRKSTTFFSAHEFEFVELDGIPIRRLFSGISHKKRACHQKSKIHFNYSGSLCFR